MPRFDGTGPMGQGPKDGRGFGPCTGGLGIGFGRGCGRRWQYSGPVTLSKDEQRKILEAELKELETEKHDIEKKLNQL